MRLRYHIYSGLDGTAENREGIVLDITTGMVAVNLAALAVMALEIKGGRR